MLEFRHSLYPPPPAERAYLGILEVGAKGGGLENFQDSGGGLGFAGTEIFQGGVGFWKKKSPAAGIQESGFSKISSAAG